MITQKTIKVLVVDDSAMMREMIGDLIKDADGLSLLNAVPSGEAALDMINREQPDIISLDVEMPGMGGLETLKRIIHQRPTPVVMVSAFTQVGADLTQRALELGALDFVTKPRGLDDYHGKFNDTLVGKIRNLAVADVNRILDIRRSQKSRKPIRRKPSSVTDSKSKKLATCCIAIGISTGGPPALSRTLSALAPPLPPIFVVQHMPEKFTRSLADRLNGISQLTVKEAVDGMPALPNHCYIAAGGKHMGLARCGDAVKLTVYCGQTVSGHCPSVDVMMTDVAKIYGSNGVGVIMTGMGRDGADGCGLLKQQGAYVLGQNKASSDVYGMNKVAFEAGNVDRQFELDQLPDLLTARIQQMLD